MAHKQKLAHPGSKEHREIQTALVPFIAQQIASESYDALSDGEIADHAKEAGLKASTTIVKHVREWMLLIPNATTRSEMRLEALIKKLGAKRTKRATSNK